MRVMCSQMRVICSQIQVICLHIKTLLAPNNMNPSKNLLQSRKNMILLISFNAQRNCVVQLE